MKLFFSLLSVRIKHEKLPHFDHIGITSSLNKIINVQLTVFPFVMYYLLPVPHFWDIHLSK